MRNIRPCPLDRYIGCHSKSCLRTLGAAVHLFPVVMDVAESKEPRITGRTAIRVLKQHMVKEPIYEAAFSRMEEFFATALGTTRDSSSLRNGFVHGEFPLAGNVYVTASSGFSAETQSWAGFPQ